jgi:hypothetical protein
MDSLQDFICQRIHETEQALHRRGKRRAADAAERSFLEGRLEALRLVLEHLEKLEERKVLLSGSHSTFSSQG